MKYAEKNVNFFGYIYQTAVSSRLNIAFLGAAYFLMCLNAWLSDHLKMVASNKIINQIINKKYLTTDLAPMYRYFIFLIISHYAISELLNHLKTRIGLHSFRKAMREVVEETTSMQNSEFHATGTGKAQERITRSSNAMHDATLIFMIDIPSGVIYFLLGTYRIYNFFLPTVALLYFLGIFVCVLFAFLVMSVVSRYETRFYELYRRSLVSLTDILINMDIIQAYNTEERESIGHYRSLDAFDKEAKSFSALKETLNFFQKMSIMIPHFVILLFFVMRYNIGLDPSNLAFYNTTFMSYKTTIISLRNDIFKLLKISPEVKQRFPKKEKVEKDALEIREFRGPIEACTAELVASEKLISQNLSFSVKRGEKVAITGHNGSGKSTFLKTLLRFHEGRDGFYVDGVPLRKLKEAPLRDLIAYVPQDHCLFNNTVMYNLSYAQKRYDEQEVYRVCKLYGYHEMFLGLPNGYFTQVGENGKYLSGGQKQRIGFIRAILKDAPIIILDEPTANLDKAAECDLVKNIFDHCAEKTVLIIIHNLELLKNFEKILYFTKNGVQTLKSHEELVLVQ